MVMQAVDVGDWHDRAPSWRLDSPRDIETLPPDGPDEPFGVRILPRRTWGCENFADIHH